jgi:dynein heavy chain
MLKKFSEIIRSNLTKMLRAKVVALVTIEIHARDVIEKLIKANCSDVNAFEWMMQLRVYWERVRNVFFLFSALFLNQ